MVYICRRPLPGGGSRIVKEASFKVRLFKTYLVLLLLGNILFVLSLGSLFWRMFFVVGVIALIIFLIMISDDIGVVVGVIILTVTALIGYGVFDWVTEGFMRFLIWLSER
jgi:hypothetical protein